MHRSGGQDRELGFKRRVPPSRAIEHSALPVRIVWQPGPRHKHRHCVRLGWQARGDLNPENLAAQITYQNGRLSVSQSAAISHVSPLMDAMTQMTEVLIDLEESADRETRPAPGQFGEVQLTGAPIQKAVWLPQTALFEREQVLLSKDNILEIKAVNVVAAADRQILVVGLEDGDLVVIERPLWIFPGQRVAPMKIDF